MNNFPTIIIFTLLLLPGLLGIIIPILPGIPYMFLVTLGYLAFDRLQHLTVPELGLLGLIAILSLVIDYSSGVLGARWGGANKKSLLYGTLGLLIGLILLPPFGSFIGLFVGVLLGELSQRKERSQAVKAATGSLIGTVGGIVTNLVLALIYISLFVMFAR